MEALNDSIRALTTQEQWEGGVALFEGGAVMNVRITSKQANAKVASEHGRFENVVINNRNDCLVGRCTCNLHTQWCKHEIALLLLVSKEEPEFLKNLQAVNQDALQEDEQQQEDVQEQDVVQGQDGARQSDENGAASEADGADVPSEKDDCSKQLSNYNDCQLFAVESFRKIFASSSFLASLRLTCTTELPPLLLSTQRVFFTGGLIFKGGEYALVNLQKLVDGLRASGDMRLDMFSLQAQQAMFFIVKYAKFTNNGFSLTGEQLADFYHCIVGSNILSTPSGAVRINTGLSTLVLMVKERSNEFVTVEFGVDIVNRGILKNDDLHIITARSGYWFGHKNEFWWLPAFIPFKWLLKFINGCSMQITADELSNIIHRSENKEMQVKVLFQNQPEMTKLPIGKMKPILTLDWHTDGLVADLQF
ncbi:MAG: hypothetical protein J5833_04120, partial [Victivallales bacterium]|nr:hypothetical protein [Victivallales bacterium]